MKTGLVSVTFRQKTPLEIISLCRKAGLDGIEWGTDVHITDAQIAKEVKAAMEGLAVISLGSYYRIGEGQDFAPVLASAVAMGAPNIRVWAGSLEPDRMTAEGRAVAVQDAKRIADMAAEKGIDVSFEYHGNTLTATHASALQLMEEIDKPNFYLYWQPIYEREQSIRLAEIEQLGQMGKLKNVHVYTWRGIERYPLALDEQPWRERLAAAAPYADAALLEFVKEDAEAQFFADAALLKQLAEK